MDIPDCLGGYDSFCINNGVDDNNHIVAHEWGHNIHRRALNYSGVLTNGTCGSYGWSSSGSEKCATAEGWASFVAGAIYWPASEPTPWYNSGSQELEGRTTSGNSGVEDVCVSKQPPYGRDRTAPGNAARYFWDLYDSTTSTDTWGTDNVSLSFSTLVSTWAEFSVGSGNRDNYEAGAEGRNVFDFEYYEPAAYGEIGLNCLENQEQ